MALDGAGWKGRSMRVRVDIVRRSDIRPTTTTVSTTAQPGQLANTIDRIVGVCGVNRRTHDVCVTAK